MFFTERKLESRVNELNEYRYRSIISLNPLLAKEDTTKSVNPEAPTLFENWDIIKTGETWVGRDRYLWIHKEVTIPSDWQGKKVLGLFDYGNTGAGNNSGFESLLYINEIPYQGVDSNHKEVFLKEEWIGQTIRLTFRLWSGLEGGGIQKDQEHKIKRAELAWLDEKVDDLYYFSTMILDTLKNLEDTNAIKHELKIHLDQAFQLIDWSYPGTEAFYQSVHKADEYLCNCIETMEKHSSVTVKCVGHTHIDVAWLWRLKHTREKVSRSFSTVLRLMEQYPEYIFLQTQPQLYEYIKTDFPEIYEKIKEKVADGRWEIDGGMWVEADCNLTSGESLTRQILIGSRFIKEEFGKDINYLWLPDVFGYSWALPQILKKSGIDMFMTTKISWNQYNRMPHDTFYWKGIDGSEVLTHFITTPDPWSEPGSWFYTYNGQLTPKTVKGVWDAYSEKDMNQQLLIAYGYGDGGGGVNRDNLEQRRRIDQIPGLPNLKTSTAKEYFEDLKETVKNTKQYVHTWDGELYLEYHRGTYTSHAYNKRINRKMELYYRETEWLTSMVASLAGNMESAKQEELTKGWKILLTNQFHDIIPGSSITEVYEDCVKDYETAEQIAKTVWEEAKESLIKQKEHTYTIINNSNWSRTEIIQIPASDLSGYFQDSNGTPLISQKVDNTWYVEVKQVPAFGFAQITFQEGDNIIEKVPFIISEQTMQTPFYSISWNAQGQLTSIYDLREKREVLAPGKCGNVLQVFEDKPLGNDAWDIDIYYQQKMREVTDLTSLEIIECNALRAVIRMEWNYMNSNIKQDMIVYSDNTRIDFKTVVDYHEKQQLLKASFPVDIRSTYATYDIQYGNVRRPNHWNTSWDQARFETVAHRFADLSEPTYGVSLLNDCKYGYDIKDNVMRITLIKTALHPDPIQDQGIHEFTYSLLPHKGDYIMGKTVKEAFALNQPLTAICGGSTFAQHSFFTINDDAIEVDAVKQSEDKNYLVIRFHEYTGAKRTIMLTPGIKITGWMESDLRERPLEQLHLEEEITLTVNPFEIKTILIQL